MAEETLFQVRVVEERTKPFILNVPISSGKRPLGIADGKFIIPDNLDEHNTEIAAMFGI